MAPNKLQLSMEKECESNGPTSHEDVANENSCDKTELYTAAMEVNGTAITYVKKNEKINGTQFKIETHGEKDSVMSSESSEDHENWISHLQLSCNNFVQKYSKSLWGILIAVCVIGYTVYFAFAISYDRELAQSLIVVTTVVVACVLLVLLQRVFGGTIYKYGIRPWLDPLIKYWYRIQWFVYPGLLIALTMYLAMIVQNSYQFQAFVGIFVYMIYTYLTSRNPSQVQWSSVYWGMVLQAIFAILILRTTFGYATLDFLGDFIRSFLSYAYEGAGIIFGDPWMLFHRFAFMGMSIVLYMGAILGICYYYGIIQAMVIKTAWLMQKCTSTGPIEAMGLSANIFLDGVDTMLMLQPYLDKMSSSELHTFLVSCHATAAGFLFGLFLLFGASPQHLLAAAFLSAPAVIAIAKLSAPDTENVKRKSVEELQLKESDETNGFEALASGAAVAGKAVMAIIINYLVIVSLLDWVNASVSWLGGRVGYPEVTFESICSYVLWPLPWLMGVESSDCQEVARLLGLKFFTNEIFAFQELGISYRAGILSTRSWAITTYALSGFSSIAAIGISVGVWLSLCPQRIHQVTGQLGRVFLNANTVCFLTASMAGIFYQEDFDEGGVILSPWLRRTIAAIPGYRDLLALIV